MGVHTEVVPRRTVSGGGVSTLPPVAERLAFDLSSRRGHRVQSASQLATGLSRRSLGPDAPATRTINGVLPEDFYSYYQPCDGQDRGSCYFNETPQVLSNREFSVTTVSTFQVRRAS